VPPVVTVRQGEIDTSVNIETQAQAVLVETPALITALYLGAPRSATLLVRPPTVRLLAVRLEPSVVGGDSLQGTVVLSDPAPDGGAVVILSATGDSRELVTVSPNNVNVPAGSTTQTFTLETQEVAEERQVMILGALDGTERSVDVRLVPRAPTNRLDSFVLDEEVSAGEPITGRVALTEPASETVRIALAVSVSPPSAASNVTAPSEVHVFQGRRSGTFEIMTRTGSEGPLQVSVRARLGNNEQVREATVTAGGQNTRDDE
jgi:hypothetical protein